MDLCRNLRWKSISLDLEDPDELRAAFARNAVPYSCLQTCRSWGDDLAGPELCHAVRACSRPSALTLRLRAAKPD